jgi:Cdc6-like AAA superfamily ATPase
MSAPPVAFPWINIPLFAQPGQKHAFADREEQLAQLYKAIVSAGNAVRTHETAVRHRYVVSGYMGVGKSALILQVLGMIREEDGVVAGQTVKLPAELPEPEDRQRWLILRASGKTTPSVDAIADALQRSMLSVMDDVREEAERKTPHVLELSFIHRLFRRREARLYEEVKRALQQLTSEIQYVRAWQGALQTRSLEQSIRVEAHQQAEAEVEAQLQRVGGEPRTAEAKAGLKAAAGLLRKTAMSATTSVEHRLAVSTQLVVDALNHFFAATDRAGIPTILVLDDFDEFASSVGPSHHDRSRVLSTVLGAFSELAPTCLIIGLREEYTHEDVMRQYRNIPVPPFTRAVAAEALDAWSRVQSPSLEPDVARALRGLGDRFLQRFEHDEPAVIPFRFLQLVAWVANNIVPPDAPVDSLVLRYLKGNFSGEVVRAIQRIAAIMPAEHIPLCAEATPLEPEPYQLTERERLALSKAGLLRPAVAGDPSDTRLVLDPLVAYFRAAKDAAASPGA